jgi:uncharacterized protein DUF5670
VGGRNFHDDWVLARQLQHVTTERRAQKENMLWTIIGILVVLWLLGFALSIGGALIHLLLVVALVVFVINLVKNR